jgi:hypothetical protein
VGINLVAINRGELVFFETEGVVLNDTNSEDNLIM